MKYGYVIVPNLINQNKINNLLKNIVHLRRIIVFLFSIAS